MTTHERFETIRLSLEDGVARLTLADGQAGNPVNPVFAREFCKATILLDQSQDVRVVHLSADGPNFCVGGDLRANAFGPPQDRASAVQSVTADYHFALSVLLRIDAPIVTAVQGASAGAGVALAALGDIVVAADTAHFTMAYSAIAVSPDGGSTFVLPRLIGLRRCQELMLTNRRVLADEAVRIGLVTEMVPPAMLAARSAELVQLLAHGATSAFSATRRLLLESPGTSLETQLEREAPALSAQCRTADAAEAMIARSQHRAPRFTGRWHGSERLSQVSLEARAMKLNRELSAFRSVRCPAAIDNHARAGHQRRRIRSEKDNRAHQVLDLSETAEFDFRQH